MAATIGAAGGVSVEQYLQSSFEHDMELIDGELKERPMPTQLHSFVQSLLCRWFGNHEEIWGVFPLPEVRTRVTQENFRLPDLAVVRVGPLTGKVLANAPLIAIEILSDDDRFADLARRAADFTRMGVEHVWLLDAEERRAHVYLDGMWHVTQELLVAGSPVFLDLAWLWGKVDTVMPQRS